MAHCIKIPRQRYKMLKAKQNNLTLPYENRFVFNILFRIVYLLLY